MNFKNLEDKCLYYRNLSDYRLVPNQYVIMMLDGRAFSKCQISLQEYWWM